jgi:hypothetical protein
VITLVDLLKKDLNVYLPGASCHTTESIKTTYADNGYFGEPNRVFLSLHKVRDWAMRKDTMEKLTESETEKDKHISKKCYTGEQCFRLSHLYQSAYRARLPTMMKRSQGCQSRNPDLWKPPQRSISFVFYDLHARSTFHVSALGDISYQRAHGSFSSLPCGMCNIFCP